MTRVAAIAGVLLIAAIAWAVFQAPGVLANSIKVDPAFQDFEGVVSSLAQEPGRITGQVKTAEGERTFTVTGLPGDIAKFTCHNCRVLSRVDYSPRGPSQVVTFLDGERPICAIGVNTEPGASLLPEASGNGKDLTLLPDTSVPEAKGQALRIEGPDLDKAIRPGETTMFQAREQRWQLHVSRSVVIGAGDVASAPSLDTPQLRTDWLLLAKP